MKLRQILPALVRLDFAWTILWAAVTLLLRLARWMWANLLGVHYSFWATHYLARFVVECILGGVVGLLFATILMVLERRQSVGTLRVGRTSTWGAAGGLLLGALTLIPITAALRGSVVAPLLPYIDVDWLVQLSLTGAICGAATLAVARRGVPQDDTGALPSDTKRRIAG